MPVRSDFALSSDSSAPGGASHRSNRHRSNHHRSNSQASHASQREDAERNPSPGSDAPGRLLAAAGPIFAARGFDAATLREIATAANVNVAAVSYHFGDKMGLYRRVVHHVTGSRVAKYPLPPVDGSADPRESFRSVIRILLSRMIEHSDGSWEHQLMLRELQHPTSVFPEIVNEYFRPLYEHLCGLVRRSVGPSVAAATVHHLAISVIGQCLYYRVGRNFLNIVLTERQLADDFGFDTLIDHITRVTWAAVQSYRDEPPQCLADSSQGTFDSSFSPST